jgi:hypothetical protein
VALGFGQIEAEGYGPVRLQAFTGSNREAFLIQVEQFAKVHNHAGLRGIETGVNRGVEFLTNPTSALSVESPGNWIR